VRKGDFDHLVAVAASITGEDEIVVIGNQAILGSVEAPPEAMLRSLEADLYPRADPTKAEQIDGAIGDGSQFQATYGYYAHGVGPETAKAPAGWEGRLVRAEVQRRPVKMEPSSPSASRYTTLCSPSAPPVANGTGSSPRSACVRRSSSSGSYSMRSRTCRWTHRGASTSERC
jgi:hypothetical protein